MVRLGFVSLLVLLLGASLSPVLAQPNWPLAAVGRIGSGDRMGCSATLIEPDLVLTAAHCATNAMKDPGKFVFVTGSYPGLPAQSVPVARAAPHPIYLLNFAQDVARVRFDLALLQLERKLDATLVVPLDLATRPEIGETIILASYRGGAGSHARERACQVFAEDRDVIAIGCEVKGGESGSPVIRKTDAGLKVVAVLSSKTTMLNQPVGFAAPVVPRIETVREALEAP
jgi:V8-like Glu-specific endopeptidase